MVVIAEIIYALSLALFLEKWPEWGQGLLIVRVFKLLEETPDLRRANTIIFPGALAVDPTTGLSVHLELLNIFKFGSCGVAIFLHHEVQLHNCPGCKTGFCTSLIKKRE